MFRLPVVERAEGARGVFLHASLGHMAKLTAVLALGEPIGGDDGGDLSGSGEEANRGTHRDDVLWLDGYRDGGRELALSGRGVRVEESDGEDGHASGIPDGGGQSVEEVLGVGGEVGDREGVDGQL